ncbi:methyltransferase [Antrihabitans sp. YC2-6]|uniref:methyltransferase n=1 Tax=Antrihabitans sp. YC2-6 TaxID=2799498 RepID=UPI0018F38B69|nr:methyltransferase [Antrihabitans sp. YC2-6]MBJ8343818.1 methyltransferase [Antrihabitans sp. YC2-6]
MDTDEGNSPAEQGAPDPGAILQLGTAFWASKTLLSAIELGLFTELASGPLGADDLGDRLGLHQRSRLDFFDALVALKMLDRTDGGYANTRDGDLFLDRNKPSYVGGILEMMNARLFEFWNGLTDGLRTGEPQNEIKLGGATLFDAIYSDDAALRQFLRAMSSISAGSAQAIAAGFPWERYSTVIDIGCAEGCVPVAIARAHPHITGGGFDLQQVQPVFEDYVEAAGLSDRLKFHPGDFFADPLPRADVLVMGHILHDWNLEEKRGLLEKAFNVLDDGGVLIVYEAIIDDDRRENAFGLLMSLNMLIESPGGFDYTGADCQRWMREAGFSHTYVQHLAGPESMVVGIK